MMKDLLSKLAQLTESTDVQEAVGQFAEPYFELIDRVGGDDEASKLVNNEALAWMGGYERDELAKTYEVEDVYELTDMISHDDIANGITRHLSGDDIKEFVAHFERHYDLNSDEELAEVGVNDIDDEECDNCGSKLHNGECPQCDADDEEELDEGEPTLKQEFLDVVRDAISRADDVGYGHVTEKDVSASWLALEDGDYEEAAEALLRTYTDKDGGEVGSIQGIYDDVRDDMEFIHKTYMGVSEEALAEAFIIPRGKAAKAYQSRKAQQRRDMNAQNDPGAAKKHLALSVLDKEKAHKKADEKGITPSEFEYAVGHKPNKMTLIQKGMDAAKARSGKALPEASKDEPADYDAKKAAMRKRIEQHQSRDNDDWFADEEKPKVRRFKAKYGTSYDAGEDDLDEACSKKKMKEGNKFSGELTKAKAAGKEEFEVDGKKYKVSEGKAKPDFMDLDKDGDTEESMKKASKEAKMKQTVSESVQLDECGMDEGNVNVSGSPDALMALMKLAGMQQPVASAFQPEAPATATMPAVTEAMGSGTIETQTGTADYDEGGIKFDNSGYDQYFTWDELEAMAAGKSAGDGFSMTMDNMLGTYVVTNGDEMHEVPVKFYEKFGLNEEYANEPEEEYSDVDAVIASGDDLHKEKKSFKPAAGGDNPMSLDEELWKAYEAMRDEVK